MKNDPVFKTYSAGVISPGLDRITIQAHENNKGDTNVRKHDKYNICYYCGHAVIKMARHFLTQHEGEEEVKPIVKMDIGSVERKNAFSLLTLKGNFLHNCHVLKDNKGVLLVLRRLDANATSTDPSEYIPCIYCLGFIQKAQAYKHVKTCIHLKITSPCDNQISIIQRSNRIVSHSKNLLEKMVNHDTEESEDWNKLKAKFKNDSVSNMDQTRKSIFGID